MRHILSVSLPQKTAQLIKRRALRGGYSTVSRYIQHIVELENDDTPFISERELLAIIKEGDREYAKGKTVKNKTLRDLV